MRWRAGFGWVVGGLLLDLQRQQIALQRLALLLFLVALVRDLLTRGDDPRIHLVERLELPLVRVRALVQRLQVLANAGLLGDGLFLLLLQPCTLPDAMPLK